VEVDYSREAAVVEGNLRHAEIDKIIARPMEERPGKKYLLALTVSSSALLIGALCVGITLFLGVGTWGNNQPVGWAFGIVNFVFWIGININSMHYIMTDDICDRCVTFREEDRFGYISGSERSEYYSRLSEILN